jgi:hypothetical protein
VKPTLEWWVMLALGFVLVMVGAILPWMMVLGTIRSTFALNILSFAASVAGVMLGIAGAAYFVRLRRK